MTVSIFSVLATLPSGLIGSPLSAEEMQAYLKANVGDDHEVARNKRHAERDEFYRDGGVRYMERVIDDVFTDPTVKALRKKWVPYARFNNALKRIVNELSTVYSEPAHRQVGPTQIAEPTIGVEGQAPVTPQAPTSVDNDHYQDLLDRCRMDERMVEVGRLLNLHRALLVGFRVRAKPDGTRDPVIDVVTPASVRVILHPNDNTLVVGWLVKCSYRTARKQTETPAWTLWTDHESVQLTEGFRVIGETYKEHALGVCPWVPVTLGPPAPGFWPGCEGEDLVAAHVAIWFENVLTLKESKSATKQTMISGDGTNTARAQASDTEVAGELADGQTANTVDMSMDLDLFKSTTDHILRNVAQNYGISPALIEHQGVQSAEARELMRIPLRELRRQQQVPLRRFESDFAKVMSAVVAVDMAELAFKTQDWRIEFAESETPLDPLAEQQLFELRRAAGLDNTIAMLMRRYPGLTEEGAWQIVRANILIETVRNQLMRPLMQISGSMGANTPTAAPAEAQTAENAAGTRSEAQRPTPMPSPPAE